MEVSGMDNTELRLMFVLGLVALAIATTLLARAVDYLVTGWRAYRQRAVEPARRPAPFTPQGAPGAVASPEPDRRNGVPVPIDQRSLPSHRVVERAG
jgi:hypothetical protein